MKAPASAHAAASVSNEVGEEHRGREEWDNRSRGGQGVRPFGLGEVSLGPVMGAIGNAVAHALGARLRDLPLTRERIAAALLSA